MSLLRNIKVVKEPTEFRTHIRSNLNNIVKDEKISTNIEISVYNYAINEANILKIIKKWDNPKFVLIYNNRLRSIWFNLLDTDNTETNLLKHIKDGSIKYKNLQNMTHQEMKPDKWKKLIEDKIRRDKNKYEVDMRNATDEFQCRKCWERKCSYYQLQTRSADEPMTTFVTCLNCGNNWKC